MTRTTLTDEERAAREIEAAHRRVTMRPRQYLEAVEAAARALVHARDGDPRPSAWAAAEHELRRVLGEPPRKSWPIPPWDVRK